MKVIETKREQGLKKHYVVFYSPGTIVAEKNVEEIDSWDVNKAIERSKNIIQRYGAKPYGFRFKTRYRGPKDFDSKEVASSNMYYLPHCIARSLAEIEAENNDNNKILLDNMRINRYEKVVQTTDRWLWAQPLKPEDVILTADEEHKEEGP
jgi:hypothetical protein